MKNWQPSVSPVKWINLIVKRTTNLVRKRIEVLIFKNNSEPRAEEERNTTLNLVQKRKEVTCHQNFKPHAEEDRSIILSKNQNLLWKRIEYQFPRVVSNLMRKRNEVTITTKNQNLVRRRIEVLSFKNHFEPWMKEEQNHLKPCMKEESNYFESQTEKTRSYKIIKNSKLCAKEG